MPSVWDWQGVRTLAASGWHGILSETFCVGEVCTRASVRAALSLNIGSGAAPERVQCNTQQHTKLTQHTLNTQCDEASKKLIKVTHDALMAAIDVCKPGARFRDLGDVISRHVTQNG